MESNYNMSEYRSLNSDMINQQTQLEPPKTSILYHKHQNVRGVPNRIYQQSENF